MKRVFFILCVLGIVLSQNVLYAQDAFPRKASYPTLFSVVEYRLWEKDLGDESYIIYQLSAPTMLTLPITRSLVFDVTSSVISSSADDKELSGVGDVKVRAVAMIMDDTIMLTAGVNAPTGKSDMSMEEIAASGLLSRKALGFRYNRLGEGLDINVGFGIAESYEPVTLGFGVGYLIKGEYAHLEDEEDSMYKPGDQLNLTGGFDLLLSPLLLRSDAVYTIYQEDTENDMEVLKEGTRLSVSETLLLSTDRFSILLSGTYIDRGETEFLSARFGGESSVRYGAQINLGGAAILRVSRLLALKLLFDGVLIEENDSGTNDARVFGFGAGVNLGSTSTSYIDLAGKYYTGDSNDGDISLEGFSTTAAIRVMF